MFQKNTFFTLCKEPMIIPWNWLKQVFLKKWFWCNIEYWYFDGGARIVRNEGEEQIFQYSLHNRGCLKTTLHRFLYTCINFQLHWIQYQKSRTTKLPCSVATKIENGPKTNTKILRFLKIDRRRIRRIFVNSKILRRLQILRISSMIANSSNIFEDTKIFKR